MAQDPEAAAQTDSGRVVSPSRLNAFGGRVVDLTHRLTPDFPLFPGVPPMKFDVIATVQTDGWYEAVLTIDEHTGTHVDAPAHFASEGATIEIIPAERLVAPLVVVQIAERAVSDPDTLLNLDDLLAWERRNGQIPPGAFIAMDSGWDRRAADPPTFLNTDTAGVMHYPGFHPDAAAFLVHERDIVGIGVDTLSLDHGPTTDFPTHLTVLPAGKYGVEALANLGQLPPSGATIVVGGLTHVGGSGSPARVLALI
ncbi:MAG TPA: cyclase family protein [Thermomicrobiales bacterium]|jgi:kynurenine formamidase